MSESLADSYRHCRRATRGASSNFGFTFLLLPAEKRRELNEQTDPTWPHVHARLDCQYDEFIRLFPCNHVIGVPGDLTEELVAFCELTRITPVLCGPRGRTRIAPIWERV